MKTVYKKIILLLTIYFFTLASYAITAIDHTALSNNLAVSPGIQSKTQGYDLLSGKVIQNIPLVKGNLPFSMQYHASLRLGNEAGVDLYQELDEGGIADWSNEYSGYVVTSTAADKTSTFIIQLPGSSEKYIITKDGTGKFRRLYYTGGGQFPSQTFYSTILRDISFSQVNGAIIIVKDGIKYTAAVSKTLSSVFGATTIPSYLFKFTQIEFMDGRKLTLSYDNGTNLIQVKDNRNNILNILREYKKVGATSQSYLERKLITGVELKSGLNTQKSTITYQEAQVKSIIDPTKTETRYTITKINSVVGGQINFQYEDQVRGYLIQYVMNNTNRNITNGSEANYPILNKVTDQNNNVLRAYSYGNVVGKVNNTSSIFNVYTTQITSYSLVNGQKVQESISAYDDANGYFANQFTVNGQKQNFNYTIDTASLGKNVNEADLQKMLNASVTMTMSNSYPGLISGSTPVRSVTYNPFTRRITSLKDFNGNVSNFTYDNLNRLSQASVAVGNVDSQVTKYGYTTLSNGAANTYPTPNTITTDSQTVTNTINPNGWLTQQVISYPKGGSSKTLIYTYNTDATKPNYGLISSVDGPRSDVNDSIALTYDNFGNKATITQNVNNKAVITKYLNYNSFAQPERIIYPSSLVDQFTYNVDGTIQAKITGTGGESGAVSGATSRFTYDYLKRTKSETNPDNETTLYDYDAVGRLIKTTAPDGSITNQTYFDTGEIKSIEGASLTYNEIDTSGRISKNRSGNDGNAYWTSFSYDGNGNKTQTQTALGIVEKWSYDALNRNTTYTDGNGNVSTKAYDKTNNVTSAKDAVNSGSSPYTYISSTLIKDETNSDFNKKSYTYTLSDQVLTKTHGSRTCTHSNVDSLGRIGGISCSNENGSSAAYAYNYQYTYDSSRFGRLDKVSSTASFGVDTQYSYDSLDRVIGKTQNNKSLTTWGGANTALSISYAYSAADKVKSITLPSGREISYNYDGTKGRLASVSIAGTPFISSFAYDALGQLTSWNLQNTNASYMIGYDASKNGAVKSVSFKNKANSIIYKEEYMFDKDGRTITINQLNSSNTYTYDNANRLINERSTWYVYDTNGNRLNEGGNKYSYDSNTNRLIEVRNNDNDRLFETSNLTTGEVISRAFLASYDGNGQMRYSGGTGGQYYMAYNHKNERTIRSLSQNGSSWATGAVQYLYDENSNLVGEYAANGTPIVEYVWMGSQPIAAIYGSGSATKIYAIITDRNNTPRMLIDNSNNAVVWQWQSTAFGVGKSAGSIKFNLRFPGQYYDEFTGLHYNLNRYYNPEIGRYMEPDPIGLEGGLNPYAYAGSNPISNVDSSGLLWLAADGMSTSGGSTYFNYSNSYSLGGVCLINYNYSDFRYFLGSATSAQVLFSSDGIEATYPEFWFAGIGGAAKGLYSFGEAGISALKLGGVSTWDMTASTAARQALRDTELWTGKTPLPKGMTNKEFGKLAGWGSDAPEAWAKVKTGYSTAEIQAIKDSGISRTMIEGWKNTYSSAGRTAISKGNPKTTPSARERLMQQILDGW